VFFFLSPLNIPLMNTQATLEKMRQLKLTAMGQAYQAFLSLPLQEQSASNVSATLATFIEAEVQERQARKTLATVRAARFRYQASLEETVGRTYLCFELVL
jgi:hypothetical protein